MAPRQCLTPTVTTAESPVESLAAELLIAIFIYSLPLPDDHGALRSKAPLLLIEVCRRWRDIALTTPELWNSIDFIEPRKRSPSRFSLIRSGLVDWFSRASDHSLSLSVIFRPNGFSASNISSRVPWLSLAHLHIKDDSLSPLHLLKVFRQCPRLITCNIEGVNCHQYEPSSPKDLHTAALPQLTSLKLSIGTFWSATSANGTTMSLFPGVFHLPALKVIEVHGREDTEHDWLLVEFLMPQVLRSRATLTHLVLRDISFNVDSFRVFLVLMPTLEHLHLTPKGSEHQGYTPLLRRLSYVDGQSHNILPRLEVLSVEDNVLDAAAADRMVLDMAESRRWTKENYPYKQKDLRQLRKLNVVWLNMHMPPSAMVHTIPSPLARERAIALEAGGLDITYPSLWLPSQVTESGI